MLNYGIAPIVNRMKSFKFLLIVVCVINFANGLDMILNLKAYSAKDKSLNVFKLYDTLEYGGTRFTLQNINPDVGFLVFQVHSYVYNLTLYHNASGVNSTVTGTNTGLIYMNSDKSDSSVFYVYNNNSANVSALVVVTLYENEDPVPGGCNLSPENRAAVPYQSVNYNSDMITVKSQPPSVIGMSCESNGVEVEMYHYYMTEQTYDKDRYMTAVETMINVDGIRRNGKRVDPLSERTKYERTYTAYQGTGEVFAVIAKYQNRTSAYVPAVTYACDLTDIGASCVYPGSGHWKILCAFYILLGLLVCFYGHSFFKCTLFLAGDIFAVLAIHVPLLLYTDLSDNANGNISTIFGVLFGLFWVFVWWKFGIPYISISPTLILAGLLITSVFFYAGLADLELFRSNVNYWSVFGSILATHMLVCTIFPFHGHLFCCSLLGGYLFTMALCYYIGGNMHYIVINLYRRMTDMDYNMAVQDPPYQVPDIAHTLVWIVTTALGYRVQFIKQQGKPPFPPSRPGGASYPSEETPLFAEADVEEDQMRF